MKKMIFLMVVFAVALGGICAGVALEKRQTQKEAERLFQNTYTGLILNLRNMNIEGIEAEAVSKYQKENTQYGVVLTTMLPFTSYDKNSILDEVVNCLHQASGYAAIADLKMTKELYDQLAAVSEDWYQEAVAEKAYQALSEAMVY